MWTLLLFLIAFYPSSNLVLLNQTVGSNEQLVGDFLLAFLHAQGCKPLFVSHVNIVFSLIHERIKSWDTSKYSQADIVVMTFVFPTLHRKLVVFV